MSSKTHALEGFTFIEMIIVIAIMTILMATILLQSSAAKGQMELLNSAYDLSLLVREAQTYGTATKEKSQGSTDPDAAQLGYGIYLSTSGSENSATLFVDTNDNGVYNSNEARTIFTLPPRVSLSDFCGVQGVSRDCNMPHMTIFFKRPKTDALITAPGGTYDSAELVLSSVHGGTRTVRVYVTGQIAVQ